MEESRKSMKYDILNPADHARSMIESCHGDAQEALALAHMNVDFAGIEEDRDYWDRVAIALQRIILRSRPQHSASSECVSPLDTDMGQSFQECNEVIYLLSNEYTYLAIAESEKARVRKPHKPAAPKSERICKICGKPENLQMHAGMVFTDFLKHNKVHMDCFLYEESHTGSDLEARNAPHARSPHARRRTHRDQSAPLCTFRFT